MSWLAVTIAPTLAVLVTYALSRRKIAEVHVLVNSQLTAALTRIVHLEQALSLEPGEDVKPC